VTPFSRIVGFSGRTLGDDPAKYLNTPETDIFHKGDLLFGLDFARSVIRERSAAILVEGPLDVISLHQAEFTAAVGAQSATLTLAQITALDRLGVTQLYMAFDADEAGQRATLAGCNAVASRFVVKVAKLPGRDPAEVVQEDPEGFRQALRGAIPEAAFRVAEACAGIDLATPKGQRVVLVKLKSAMVGSSLIDPVAAAVREQVIRRLELSPARLEEWLGTPKSAPPPSPAVTRTAAANMTAALRTNIAALALTHAEKLESICTYLRASLPSEDPFVEFASRCEEHGFDTSAIWQRLGEWEAVAGALEHLVRGVNLPLAHLERQLQRYTKMISAPPPKPYAYLEAMVARQAGLKELTTALPEKKREAARRRFAQHLIQNKLIALATADELLVDAAAFSACAQSWAAGYPSAPDKHLRRAA
jgi:DNA primase